MIDKATEVNRMKQKYLLLIVILQIVIFITIVIHMVLMVKHMQTETQYPPSLPCAAVPIGFVAEYPECADLLVKAMNISNFRIRPFREIREAD